MPLSKSQAIFYSAIGLFGKLKQFELKESKIHWDTK